MVASLRQMAALLPLMGLAYGAIHPANPALNVSWPYHSYKSVNYTPPVLNITHHTEPSEGYLFFAPDGATEYQLGPLIMDMHGELVWNGPKEHAFNFGVQDYLGNPVLVWWNGTLFADPLGRGNGLVYLYNHHYERIHTVTLAGNFLENTPGASYPSNIDLHELYLTKNGSLVTTANNVTTADLSSVGGPVNGWVVNVFVYEIDVATNEVLFSWNALDHLDQLPYSDTCYPLGSQGFTGESQEEAWGYFHINSIEPYGGGYLVSGRYYCSVIAIENDGNVKWRLNGLNGGDFDLVGENVTFAYQHDVRTVKAHANGVTISMHDNHNCPISNDTVPTSGKVIDVDFTSMKATLEKRYINESGPLYSTAMGSWQQLADGNVFMGQGFVPIMEEYNNAGEILSTIQFGVADQIPGGGAYTYLAPTLSYRAFKQHWTGCPTTPPHVYAEKDGKETKVYVSWNGATDVKEWEIYTGSSEATLKCVKTVKKSGFETEVDVPLTMYVQARPVLKKGSSCANIPSAIVTIT